MSRSEAGFRRGMVAGLGVAARLAAGAGDAGQAVRLVVRALSAARDLRDDGRHVARVAEEIERIALSDAGR